VIGNRFLKAWRNFAGALLKSTVDAFSMDHVRFYYNRNHYFLPGDTNRNSCSQSEDQNHNAHRDGLESWIHHCLILSIVFMMTYITPCPTNFSLSIAYFRARQVT